MGRFTAVATFGIAFALAATAACGGGKKPTAVPGTPTAASAQSEVSVTLTEYKVTPLVTSVPAGAVKFAARNIGGTAHELVVFRTDLKEDALPTAADGSVDESGAGVTVAGKTTSIDQGTQQALSLTLPAGKYVLVCNIVQTVNGQTVVHYQRGMHAAFTVK